MSNKIFIIALVVALAATFINTYLKNKVSFCDIVIGSEAWVLIVFNFLGIIYPTHISDILYTIRFLNLITIDNFTLKEMWTNLIFHY